LEIASIANPIKAIPRLQPRAVVTLFSEYHRVVFGHCRKHGFDCVRSNTKELRMETISTPPSEDKHVNPGLSIADYGFFVLMALVVALVVWVGVMSFEEGMKTEDSKRNGEEWVAWLTQASAKRFEPGFEPAECAAGLHATEAPIPTATTELVLEESAGGEAGEQAPKAEIPKPAAPIPNSWGGCVAKIMERPEFKKMVNPFTGEAPQLVEKCDPADHLLHGSIAIEKSVATPVGSAVPTTVSPLIASDAIDTKLQLKLSVCDKGAYPIRVAEFEF
jgi:hypothetical protein